MNADILIIPTYCYFNSYWHRLISENSQILHPVPTIMSSCEYQENTASKIGQIKASFYIRNNDNLFNLPTYSTMLTVALNFQ